MRRVVNAPPGIVLRGQGLHSGAEAIVRLRRHVGPALIEQGLATCRLDALRVRGTERSTTVSSPDGRVHLRTVEHLFAALAGLGLRNDFVVAVEGPELPLLDGGARTWVDALLALDLPWSASPRRVVQAGEVAVGSSAYRFEPDEATSVEVSVDFDDARLAPAARWSGDASDFARRVAPARTFGFEREVAALLASGLARHVSPESVVVIGDDAIHCAGEPFSADEPARHKLLDLLGDLHVGGGVPRGRIAAVRPGHAATRAALSQALALGIVA